MFFNHHILEENTRTAPSLRWHFKKVCFCRCFDVSFFTSPGNSIFTLSIDGRSTRPSIGPELSDFASVRSAISQCFHLRGMDQTKRAESNSPRTKHVRRSLRKDVGLMIDSCFLMVDVSRINDLHVTKSIGRGYLFMLDIQSHGLA